MQAKTNYVPANFACMMGARRRTLEIKGDIRTTDAINNLERKGGRALGGAARMATLTPAQRHQLATAAAAARWQQVGNAAKPVATKPQRVAFLARMCKEVEMLRQQRETIDQQIKALTAAVESFGGQVQSDEGASTD
jgi:hypothetical protein